MIDQNCLLTLNYTRLLKNHYTTFSIKFHVVKICSCFFIKQKTSLEVRNANLNLEIVVGEYGMFTSENKITYKSVSYIFTSWKFKFLTTDSNLGKTVAPIVLLTFLLSGYI